MEIIMWPSIIAIETNVSRYQHVPNLTQSDLDNIVNSVIESAKSVGFTIDAILAEGCEQETIVMTVGDDAQYNHWEEDGVIIILPVGETIEIDWFWGYQDNGLSGMAEFFRREAECN